MQETQLSLFAAQARMQQARLEFNRLAEKEGGEAGRRVVQLCTAIMATACMQGAGDLGLGEDGCDEETRGLDIMLNLAE